MSLGMKLMRFMPRLWLANCLCYNQIKQSILDYHIKKTLDDGIIMPIDSPNALPVVLRRKNMGKNQECTEACVFAIDCFKLNDITRYPKYPIPVID